MKEDTSVCSSPSVSPRWSHNLAEGVGFVKLGEDGERQGEQDRAVACISYHWVLTPHCLGLNPGASASQLWGFGQVT